MPEQGAAVDRAWVERAAGGGRRLRGLRSAERDAFNSRVVHLIAEWMPPASGAAGDPPPAGLVWKRDLEGHREVEIWKVLRTLPGLPVPRCFAADEHGLLLEDLSGTHEAPVTRDALLGGAGIPEGDRAGRIVDALTALHAAGWEDARLGTGELAVRTWFSDSVAHRHHVERRARELDRFAEMHPESPHLPFYGDALRHIEALFTPDWERRAASTRAMTIVQGDAYLNQFLVPRHGDGPALVLDFGDATANPGAWDLAFLLATFWTPEQRREDERERKLLRRYHDGLVAAGVAFAWESLLEDYRRMLAYLVFDPVFNAADGSSRSYWEPKMECLIAAWRDWDCGALPG